MYFCGKFSDIFREHVGTRVRLLRYYVPMSLVWVECWKCDECGHRWIKTLLKPERCPSRACRKRSWNKNQLFVPANPASADDVNAAQEASRIARDLPKLKPDMDTLRLVCAGVLETPVGIFISDERVAPGELRLGSHDGPVLMDGIGCPHEEWAPDGEKYHCNLAAGHKGKCVPGERVEA